MTGVEFRLLGDVGAVVGGRQVDVGPARQRCVLAALLLDVNRTVLTHQLIDRVWGEQPPPSVLSTLASYVTRLRTALKDEARIESRSGYVLHAGADTVDAHRFRKLVSDAREATDAERQAALLRQALDLWQGDAFGGLDTPWFNLARQHLAAERRSAERDWTDVQLRLGRHADVIASLAVAVEDEPLDERLVGQLMLAQHRSGRRVDALESYRALYSRLFADVGVGPCAAVQDLHQRILDDDASLGTDVVAAQAEVVLVQRRALEVSAELDTARRQLTESVRAEQRTGQMLLVLQMVLARLTTMVHHLTGERDRYREEAAERRAELEETNRRLAVTKSEQSRTRDQVYQARDERDRATAIALEASRRIRMLERRLSEAQFPEPPSAAWEDNALQDTSAALDRMQMLLDEQHEHLDELEGSFAEPEIRAWEEGSIGICVLDNMGRVLDANAALEDMLGYTAEQLRSLGLERLVRRNDDERLRKWALTAHTRPTPAKLWLNTASGAAAHLLVTLSALVGDVQRRYLVARVEDIGLHTVPSRVLREDGIDPLTGLCNRESLRDRLDRVLATANHVALCYVDLDDFKRLNMRFGHDTGDRVLTAVGRRLVEVVPRADVVARAGRDEFMIVVHDVPGEVGGLADLVLSSFSTPVRIGAQEIPVSASIGVVEHRTAETNARDLLREADAALWLAKSSGKGHWVAYGG